jgi:hypothetical protein
MIMIGEMAVRPNSPRQRGTNENTNRLLRQYFPKGNNLSIHSQAKLSAVARQLNERPRKTLQYQTPAEKFALCVASIAFSQMAAFTGLIFTNGLSSLPQRQRKMLIAMASLIHIGGVWSMHFVVMLALQLPVLVLLTELFVQ